MLAELKKIKEVRKEHEERAESSNIVIVDLMVNNMAHSCLMTANVVTFLVPDIEVLLLRFTIIFKLGGTWLFIIHCGPNPILAISLLNRIQMTK